MASEDVGRRERARELSIDVEVAFGQGDSARADLAVRLEIPPGITSIVGPSGAGKSTLLAAVAGLVAPSRGRVALGSETWFDASAGVDRPAHLRRVGFVFQSLALFPHLSVLANVAYGVDPSLEPAARLARARAELEAFHVRDLAERRPRTLSGGEAQRVALARVFASRASVLLLDEPFAALDHGLRKAIRGTVKERVLASGAPAILVTHDVVEATELGDRTFVLEGGRVSASV